jgi:uncharacterized SAM-binding protein YcdF (DUF218 family)
VGLIVVAAAAGLAVLVTAIPERVLPPVARWLDVGGAPQRADCAIVLPGDETVRPFVAAALVRAGLAERVLVPQTQVGPEVADGIVPPTHEIIRRVLLLRGVPAERIVILHGATGHTHGDAELLDDYLDTQPELRVTVVTSHYHTRRTRWAFRRVLGERAGQVAFVSAPAEHFTADDWWQVEAGFMAVTSEYLKLAFYAVRYGGLAWWVAAVVLALAAVVALRRWRRKRALAAAAS